MIPRTDCGMKLASLEKSEAEPFDASESSINLEPNLSELLQTEGPQMKRRTADVDQAEPRVTQPPTTSDDKPQVEDAQVMQKLRHLEAAHILGELSVLKFQVLRLTEQVEKLPTRIAAEMER